MPLSGFLQRSPWAFPGGSPKLNRSHPLFNVEHFAFAGVALGNGGMLDLISGQQISNAAVTGGVDEFGPYCVNNTTAGGLTFTNTFPSANFFTYGCIFKFISSTHSYFYDVGVNTGLWTGVNNCAFLVANGVKLTVSGLIVGHVYYFLFTNCVATAAQTQICAAYDLTRGVQHPPTYGPAGAGNITLTSLTMLTAPGSVTANRIYAGFMTGSVQVPPSVVNPSTMHSVDTVLNMFNTSPWALWYG